MKRNFLLPVVIVMFLLALVLSGCPSHHGDIKPFSEMTPKEKATFMLSMYNKQYDNYLAVAEQPDLTESQKEVLRAKKEVLTEVYPLIKLYSDYVDSGAVPDQATEDAIISYLDRLGTLVAE